MHPTGIERASGPPFAFSSPALVQASLVRANDQVYEHEDEDKAEIYVFS